MSRQLSKGVHFMSPVQHVQTESIYQHVQTCLFFAKVNPISSTSRSFTDRDAGTAMGDQPGKDCVPS